MKVELIVQTPGARMDVSELLHSVTFSDNINKCGSLDFVLPLLPELQIDVGAVVRFIANGEPYFLGYVFKRSDSGGNDTVSYTAYDQLRYLTANDSYAFDNLTAGGILQRICMDMGLVAGAIEDPGYQLGEVVEDNKSMLDMVVHALDTTLANTKQMFYIKDQVGAIIMRNIASSIVPLRVSEGENLTGYTHERSIDTDTANQIKLVRDNKESGKREVFITKDSGNIAKWGLLQHFEVIDENTNDAQAAEQADMLLQIKNRPTRKLTAEVVGDQSIRAGHLVNINIPKSGLNGFLLCLSAKHTFTSNYHGVSAEFRLV
ncbi:hypothetical protein LJC27_01805 [Christensenellaceae bacterium OttesenSCG-928-M15]|nr:hypothetical protein [Christensenellaceae bacterium OttesenSCG-928-M15]